MTSLKTVEFFLPLSFFREGEKDLKIFLATPEQDSKFFTSRKSQTRDHRALGLTVCGIYDRGQIYLE